jgi:hydroxysqualene dehydroxylase
MDRPLFEEPFIGLPGRPMQWVFDTRAIVNGAAHLSLVSSGPSPLGERTNAELLALAHEELLAALPAARAARVLRGTVIREPRATFSLAPGQPPRPPTRTAVRGLYLAGDWVDTGLPATIESAVRSGHRAADAVVAQAAARTWSPPEAGPSRDH